MVLRGRGEAERVRTVRSRVSKVVLGAFEMNCTVTSGDGPILRVEDALSSMVASAATGELTVTDCSGEVSEGDDICTAHTHKICTQSAEIFLLSFHSTRRSALPLQRCPQM